MKKTKRDQIYNIDDFEDLTLFANESFDTQDVDLFEFTSEESSPLTRLKSIILSLDWEITDEILQELADEVANLESVYQGDKVAEVYLQGLGKIGSYIRSKGAYAHPNAIKLLLTFFYDFEKSVSAPDISGEEITRILKVDIRKFKILQYQIALGEEEATGTPAAAPTAAVPAPVETGGDHRKLLKAAILSLDWEVTEESLAQYTASLEGFRAQVADNRLAQVLVQGLQAIGAYIGEQRAEAHPEAFALLHSFDEALEQIAGDESAGLDEARAREIITAQVNRLDHLKLLIASPGQAVIDEERIDQVVGEISGPAAAADVVEEPFPGPAEVEADHADPLSTAFPIELDTDSGAAKPAEQDLAAELDSLFASEAMPAMESADIQYPDEVLPPEAIHPVDDELADDRIEASLHARRGLAPALAGAEENVPEQRERDQPAEDDLAEQLDVFFAEADRTGDADQPPAAVDLGLELDFRDEPGPDEALADVAETADHIDPELESAPAGLDLDSSLDSLFAEPATRPALTPAALDELSLDLETADDEPSVPVGSPAGRADFDLEAALPPENFDLEGTLDNLFAEPAGAGDAFTGTPAAAREEDADTLAAAPADEPASALSEVDEPNFVDALGLEDMTGEPGLEDIESRLDSFFAETGEAREEEARAATPVEEIEQSLFFADDQPLTAALADAAEERGFSEEEEMAALADAPMADLEEKLDLFFGETEEPSAGSADTAGVAARDEAVAETPLETLLADLPVDAADEAGMALAGAGEETADGEGQADFFGAASEDDEEEPQTADEDDLTRALEATIAAGETGAPIAGLGLATALSPSPAEREPVLAGLGALLPGMVRRPTGDTARAVLEQVGSLAELTEDAGQRALVQLLGAVVSLLGRTAGDNDAASNALVNYLYERLLRGDGTATTLATAIGRYAAWQQEVCARLPLLPVRGEGATADTPVEYTAGDLYAELAELRAGFRDELARLRHEIEHLQRHQH
jgi:pilus assembly protein FimV